MYSAAAFLFVFLMMRSLVVLALIFPLLFFCSCLENTNSTLAKNTVPSQAFFPVTNYILGQLREIDSLPVTPLKITTINGIDDSVWMKKEDIRIFAKPFLYPDIDTANLKSFFIESSFLDRSINAFTFSYDPITTLPDSFSLKRWDVYIDPQKNIVKRIFIIKEQKNNGSLQTIQLTWKSNSWCKITTITTAPGNQSNRKEEIMKWNFSE